MEKISDCNDDISFLRVWPNHWHQQLHASTPKMVDLCRFTHLVDSWISKGQLIRTYDYSTNQNWIAHQQSKCMAVEPPKKNVVVTWGSYPSGWNIRNICNMIYTVIMILDRDFCESEGFHKRWYPFIAGWSLLWKIP